MVEWHRSNHRAGHDRVHDGYIAITGSHQRTQRNHLGYSMLDWAFRQYASGIQRTNLRPHSQN